MVNGKWLIRFGKINLQSTINNLLREKIMSRVGKQPITIPSGVDVKINGDEIEVKGPKGTLKSVVPEGIEFKQEDGTLIAERKNDKYAAMHGLARALANNAVVGVTEGFTQQMDLVGVGYKVDIQGNKLNFALGYSHPVVYPLPDGISAISDREFGFFALGYKIIDVTFFLQNSCNFQFQF
jgi:ribosomal protein L6P/L9E